MKINYGDLMAEFLACKFSLEDKCKHFGSLKHITEEDRMIVHNESVRLSQIFNNALVKIAELNKEIP